MIHEQAGLPMSASAAAEPITPERFRDALILTGPTASGKSALALEIAQALDAEIIALDSMTVYRRMDIGTAKPTAEDQARVPHHLLNELEPWESASVAWWLARAATITDAIRRRGRVPLFVGGTPFYLKALLTGLFPAPPVDAELRRRLEATAEREGPPALHARLAAVDPTTAARLHPHDVRRVVRALEVYTLLGTPISALQTQWSEPRTAFSAPGGVPRCVYLDLPRDELYDRINRRVRQMLDAGWIEEARALLELPQPMSKEAGQAIGYREIFRFLQGEIDREELTNQIQIQTRQFAKRQLTWFRSLPECRPIDAKSLATLWHSRMILGTKEVEAPSSSA